MTLGSKIIAARIHRGMSRRTLAAKLSINEEIVACYENDTKVPDAEIQFALSEILHVSVFYLRVDTCDDPAAFIFTQEMAQQHFIQGGERGLKHYEKTLVTLFNEYHTCAS